MAFNPSIVAPNPKSTVKAAKGNHHWFADSGLETDCYDMLKKVLAPTDDIMDFNKALLKRIK